MLTYGIDWDDVIAPLNERAIEIMNLKEGLKLKLSDISSWENTGNASVIKSLYNTIELYKKQYVPEESKLFINKLRQKGNVFIITAIAPEFMGIRVNQILTAFPDFPKENIIMGSQKSLVRFDVTLDDGPHNILKSSARFPILFRKPWNQNVTGTLAVNNFDEFFELDSLIKRSMIEEQAKITTPSVIALIGPSGTNKNALARAIASAGLAEIPISYTTCPEKNINKVVVSAEEFDIQLKKDLFISSTVYAGHQYGTKKADINNILADNKNIVMPLDICGAIGLKKSFPTYLVFCKRSREAIIADILSDTSISLDCKKYRILSIDKELANKNLCNMVLDTNDVALAAESVKSKIL